MDRKVTYIDIAKMANVSRSTVSKALGNASDVSDDTRKIVCEAAEELGYKNQRKIKLKKVAFVIQNTDFKNENDFGLTVLNSFRHAAFMNSFEVLLLNIDDQSNSEINYDQLIAKYNLCGAFFVGLDTEHPYMRDMQTTKNKTVLLDCKTNNNPNVSFVSVDNIEGISIVVNYLIDNGHMKIGFLNGTKVSYVSTQRLKGYILGLQLNGLEYNETFVKNLNYDFKVENEIAQHFIDIGVTAVVCACDKLAIGLIATLKKLNIKTPRDISVTGFDNIKFCDYVTPALTTVEQDRGLLGEVAFMCLSDLIEGRKGGINIEIQPKITIRESVKNLKNNS